MALLRPRSPHESRWFLELSSAVLGALLFATGTALIVGWAQAPDGTSFSDLVHIAVELARRLDGLFMLGVVSMGALGMCLGVCAAKHPRTSADIVIGEFFKGILELFFRW